MKSLSLILLLAGSLMWATAGVPIASAQSAGGAIPVIPVAPSVPAAPQAPAAPNGPSWTMQVPDGISFSVGDGERTHALRIFRDGSGTLARTTQNQIESGNWSGYVLADYETGRTYTSAAGAWAVPAAAVPP